jgi:hypothetical protein
MNGVTIYCLNHPEKNPLHRQPLTGAMTSGNFYVSPCPLCLAQAKKEGRDEREKEISEQLKDSSTAHTAILRGEIALTDSQIGHIAIQKLQSEYQRGKKEEREAEIRRARPTIVVLCGSTRFYDQFQIANYEETMKGKIVLSVGFYPHSGEGVWAKREHGEIVGITPEQKEAMDELYKRKIDLADEVFVLNVGGYIGSSTQSEIEYAHRLGKRIIYLEAESTKGGDVK